MTQSPEPGTRRPLRVQAVITGMGCGGAERQMTIVTRGLVGRGCEVRLAVLHGRDSFYELDPAVEAVFFESDQPAGSRVARLIGRPRWLRRQLQSWPPDVVLSFIDVANVNALWAARGTGIPVVVSERIHPPCHHVRWLERLVRPHLYRKAAAVVVQTEATRRWVESQGWSNQVEVIPNAVLPPEAPDEEPEIELPAGHLIVSHGRLDPQKQLHLLIRAMASLAPRFPDWHLLLLGEGPERNRLQQLATDLGLDDRILLPGTVRHPQRVLSRCHLFALTSAYEGFPNALCEALACGLPAVAVDCPVGPAEILRDGIDGLLVTPNDPVALEQALARFMTEPETRQDMAEAAMDVVSRFNAEQLFDRWQEVLGDAANAGRYRS
jgi:glycosyltransferase involved in cell wall biosynthesis